MPPYNFATKKKINGVLYYCEYRKWTQPHSEFPDTDITSSEMGKEIEGGSQEKREEREEEDEERRLEDRREKRRKEDD